MLVVGVKRRGSVFCILRLRLRWWTRLAQRLAGSWGNVNYYAPRTSSLNTRSLASSMSVPFRSSSFVLSRSLRAVTTTGALVVCRTVLASAKPMPREAGDIKDHGGMLGVMNKSFCYSRNMLQSHLDIWFWTRSMMAYLLCGSATPSRASFDPSVSNVAALESRKPSLHNEVQIRDNCTSYNSLFRFEMFKSM